MSASSAPQPTQNAEQPTAAVFIRKGAAPGAGAAGIIENLN